MNQLPTENRDEITKAIERLGALLGANKYIALNVKTYPDGRIEGSVSREATEAAIAVHLDAGDATPVACCKETYKIERPVE